VSVARASSAAPANTATKTAAATKTATAAATKTAARRQPFGPFSAGAARSVTRHGQPGVARHAHPVVGDVAHIPGDGPPPPPLWTDPTLPEAGVHQGNVVGGALSSNPLFLASLFYSNFLTRTDGPRCQHLPTCSRFASQAVARHGVLGIAMGLDRIIQPPVSSSLRVLPLVDFGGGVRHWDPIENYEFWHPERFTGLAVVVPEEPLMLPTTARTPTTATTNTTTTANTTTTKEPAR
jgi:hypothetical protein